MFSTMPTDKNFQGLGVPCHRKYWIVSFLKPVMIFFFPFVKGADQSTKITQHVNTQFWFSSPHIYCKVVSHCTHYPSVGFIL